MTSKSHPDWILLGACLALAAIGTAWSDDDEALVDTLVKPGHPSTPGYSDPRYPISGRFRD